MADWIGKVLGKVRVEKLIARGGMAEVYYGTHLSLKRPVAIKVMLSFLESDPELQTRFEREARTLANLRHHNIVQIYDFDVNEGQPYFVMEYIDGPTLAAHLVALQAAGKKLNPTQIARILVSLASALDYAHSHGVIHRDIKPGNLLLTCKTEPITPGEPLPEATDIILTDFGLLRLTDSTTRSMNEMISGTPAYMSPEQARGERADHRSDLYSMGIILYELISGRVPFEAETSLSVLMKQISDTPAPIPGLSTAIQHVLDRALAKKPQDRYDSARDLLRAYLEAADLKIAEIAPGYSLSPTPKALIGQLISAQDQEEEQENNTLLSKPKPLKRSKKAARPWLLPLALAVLGLAALVAGSLYFNRGRSASALPSPTSLIVPAVTAAATVTPTPAPALETFGLLRFYNAAGILNEVILTPKNLAPAPAGFQYQAWLVGGETRRSLGVLKTGDTELKFLDDQGRNLLVKYDQMQITLEPNPDSSPNPSDQVVFSSGLPPRALQHLRHVLVGFQDTPNQIGLTVGLVEQAKLLKTLSEDLVTAQQANNPAKVRDVAEGMFNLLVGKQSQDYGDKDGNGKVNDPGDGYGLLLNGEHPGYIEGSLQHAQLAAKMPDATKNLQLHSGHVVISAQNVEEWATALLQTITQILAEPAGADSGAQVHEAASLADRILNGRDLNGNEQIEPVPGEGGALTALQHASYMADMPIFAGEGKFPPPAVGTDTGSMDMSTPGDTYDEYNK